jgi:16S rRNA (cytosine1402-N4)-methyltransferase
MTVGAGGHAEALLDAGVDRIVGVDRDPDAVRIATSRLARFGDRTRIVLGTFSSVELPREVDGVLFDLGASSMQLDRADRGFSYRRGGPLDMRMGPDSRRASSLVNELDEAALADVLYAYGEERASRRIARAIVRARERSPIETTDELARVVAGAVGRRPGRAHPARRTFQALRIAANRELEELDASLPRASGVLGPGGRLVVIAYHSLEDRIVKRFVAGEPRLRSLVRTPARPSEAEIRRNPRSRSARLRAAEVAAEAA